MKKLLFILTIISFTGCMCVDEEHSLVRQGDKTYRIKKGTIVHKDNGCISFPYKRFEDEESVTQVEICGSYTIEN